MKKSLTSFILVVDDDADIRETVQVILELEGYQVVTAADGAEALARLRSGDALPSLILLDLMMPGMNGLQFCEERRGDPILARVPVVVVTGAGAVVREKTRELVEGILVKPVQMSDLLSMVERFCVSASAS